MILVTLCQEGEKEAALPGSSPACAPIKRLPGLFVGPRARREPAAGLSLPGAPLDRPVFPRISLAAPRRERPAVAHGTSSSCAHAGTPSLEPRGAGQLPLGLHVCAFPHSLVSTLLPNPHHSAPRAWLFCRHPAPLQATPRVPGAPWGLTQRLEGGFAFFLFAKVGLVLGLKHPDKEVNSKPRGLGE